MEQNIYFNGAEIYDATKDIFTSMLVNN